MLTKTCNGDKKDDNTAGKKTVSLPGLLTAVEVSADKQNSVYMVLTFVLSWEVSVKTFSLAASNSRLSLRI